MKTTVLFHSADFDGIFCREIARKFLPDAELIGWDFGDEPLNRLNWPMDHKFIVMDLPLDRPFGFEFSKEPEMLKGDFSNYIWIDHHASSIASHPTAIPGYRIDGVAACRLAWQYFRGLHGATFGICTPQEAIRGIGSPTKQDFIDRKVSEPLAVRLAGEYDVFDKRDPNAELFQHGLRSEELFQVTWDALLETDGDGTVIRLLNQGRALQYTRAQEYRDVITQQGFDLQFEGLNFLACNSHELDIRSQLFEAGIKPHHDALMGFTYNGKDWRVSLYRIPNKDADILSIAKKYGGGGHAGACGCRMDTMPFIL